MMRCSKADLIGWIVEEQIPLALLYGFDSDEDMRDDLIKKLLN